MKFSMYWKKWRRKGGKNSVCWFVFCCKSWYCHRLIYVLLSVFCIWLSDFPFLLHLLLLDIVVTFLAYSVSLILLLDSRSPTQIDSLNFSFFQENINFKLVNYYEYFFQSEIWHILIMSPKKMSCKMNLTFLFRIQGNYGKLKSLLICLSFVPFVLWLCLSAHMLYNCTIIKGTNI